MQQLKIALLGSPQITLDGKPVDTDRRKAIALLAYLAVEDKPRSREALAALLWPDYPRASAFSYLRRTLWELNQILGKGWIESDRENITLNRLPELSVDVNTFQSLVGSASDQVSALQEAVSLYRGNFLEGLVIADTLPFEEWQYQQVEYFQRDFAQALEKLVDALEQRGEYDDAMQYAQRWLALDRLNESAYRAIMRQMAGMGDRSGAVKVYQACVQTLKDELGVAAQEETEKLYQAILHGEQLEAHRAEAGKLPTTSKPKLIGYLPNPATPFIGRHEEIKQVVKLALDPEIHLLTLTGPGGNGKTRLSIQAAEELCCTFTDGVWFIPLAAVQSSQGLILAIAKGLGYSFFKGEETPREQLLDYLREKHSLLILDNFEHLMVGGRELVADILGSAQGVKLLITSRERLNLMTEQIYRVPGMHIPDQKNLANWDNPEEQAKSYSAIQFLIERARHVRPDFQVTQENLAAVTQICQLVDGSPLGIELAADWLELFPPEEIVKQISHNLDFLESEAVDVPERQRSLRAVFDTSWNMLNEEEKQAFKRLSVFRGSFSRQAAQVVSGHTMRTLLSLANKSWLQQADEGRYQLHEVLRQFGMERLEADQDEWQATRDRQAEYFATFLQVQGQALRTAGQIQALEALKTELESNIPEAWAWLILDCRIDILIEKMLPGIFHYGLIRRGEEDFISMLKHARKLVPVSDDRQDLLQGAILETVEINFEMSGVIVEDQPKERLEKLWAKVNKYGLQEDMGFWYIVLAATYGSSMNYQEGNRRLIEISPKIKKHMSEWDLATYSMVTGQFSETNQPEIRKKYLLEALSIYQKIGVVQEQGTTLRALGEQAAIEMDYELAIDYCQKAKRLFEQVGDSWGVDSTWSNLGEYYIYLGKIDQAFSAYEESRRFSEKIGNRRLLGVDYSWESMQTSRYGELDHALELRKKSLEISIEVKNQNDIAWHTWELGEIHRLMGDLEQAKRYYQEALPYFEKLHDQIGMGFYHRGFGDIAIMLGNWEEARSRFQEALVFHEKEQRPNSLWGLIYYHARLGTVLVHLRAFNEAKMHLKISLTQAEHWPFLDIKALPLTGIAFLMAASGFPAQAIEMAACVISKPTTWNETKNQAGMILEMASKEVSAEEARLFMARGEAIEINALIRKCLESGVLEK